MNVFSTRSCDSCAYQAPNVAEANRRIKHFIDQGATFLRLLVEDGAQGTKVSWARPSQDPLYLAALVAQVRYIGTFPGVYVMVSYWDSTMIESATWVPTAELCDEWRTLVRALGDHGPHVLFGIANEPHGSTDTYVRGAMEVCRAAIRSEEATNGQAPHIISIQMPRNWARYMGTWNETTFANDSNIVYETHFYDPLDGATNQGGVATTWWKYQIADWANRIPLIIGEFGPSQGMTLADTDALMSRSDALGIPWLAWSAGPRCPPDLLVDNSSGGCGVGMVLTPTAFGEAVKAGLSR